MYQNIKALEREALTERLEDLNGRLEELTERLTQDMLSPDYDRLFYATLTKRETDVVLPSDLNTVEDVLSAIERTKARLWDVECEARQAERAKLEAALPGQVVILGFPDLANRVVPAALAS